VLTLDAKDGVGTTTVAVNLATWRLYLRGPQEGMSSLLRRHRCGPQIFCAPPVLVTAAWLTEEQIASVM
jgi:hypothetical protein